jgi:deazaflavin-dependent oxidoreductase (nitroreductase family)
MDLDGMAARNGAVAAASEGEGPKMFQHVYHPVLQGSGATAQWGAGSLAVGGELSHPHARQSRPPGMGLALKFFSGVHRTLYRMSGGWLGSTLRGGPVLLLTTTGRKTGQDRTLPLSYVEAGDDDVVVVASAAGAPRNPAWYINLRANPRVRVQQGQQTRTMIARTVEGLDRVHLWERFVQKYPALADYQARASREIPVVVLQPAMVAGGI